MPTEPVYRPLTRQILRSVLGHGDATDQELLGQFIRSRDEESFAELVRRHGRMVLAVARRVTGHPQDAEDAFQAAFMVLARRASHLNRPEQLANWLYGVAYRTALEARAIRRRVLEHRVSSVPEPVAPERSDDTTELRRIIDEELAILPDKYRTAVVLCDLEGLPRAQAASRLRIPEGTLSSRLAHARKVLATRLTRRGISSTAGAVAVALSRDAIGSPVPRQLVSYTARAAARSASGGAIPTDLVSASVSSITEGVMKTMLVHRLRLMFGLLLLSGMVGAGAIGLAQNPGQNNTRPEVIRTNPGQNNFDPFGDPVALQPKPEKVEAKGIEDEDVPLPSTPIQAVVRVEEGKLILRQRGRVYAQVTASGVKAYQLKSGVQATKVDAADVVVFDMKGNRLMPKVWKEKLKSDVHVLVGYDGKIPNPRELTLFRDDTLLVVLPGSMPGQHGVTTSTAPAFVAPPVPSANIPEAPPAPSTRPATPRPPRPATVPPPLPDSLLPISN